MADVEVKYVNKTVTTIRGLETRSIAKWEKEGWEFLSQTPAKLLRTTLTFRRPTKQIPKWVWGCRGARPGNGHNHRRDAGRQRQRQRQRQHQPSGTLIDAFGQAQ